MSSIRLLVLGVVRIFQPIHGYDIRRELLSWHADEWGNVAPGSIYNAIKTLTREGYLSVSGTAQMGARPERTSYTLTDAGVTEHLRLLRDSWREVRLAVDPLMPALAFLPILPRAEVIEMLRGRIEQIERMIAEARWAQKHLVAESAAPPGVHSGKDVPRKKDGRIEFDDDFKPEHVFETFELMIARTASELEWSKGLIKRLEEGRYQMGMDHEQLEAARAAKKKPAAKKAPTRGKRG